MKRLAFSSFLAFCYVFCCAQSVVDSSLVAYWPFDGNTNDIGVYGNHGVAFGGPGYAPGISGQALVLDGQDDYVSVTGTSSLHDLSNEYTIAGWVKPFGVPNYYVPIITKGNDTDMRTPIAVLYRSPETTPYIRTVGQNLPFDLINIESVTQACPINKWTFFTWTFKSGKVSIYKNGEWIVEHQFGFTQLEQNFLPMDMGRDVPGYNTEWLYGMLDEVCIFNRKLSDLQIRELFRSKSYTATKELDLNSEKASIQVYPNPASQTATVLYAHGAPGKVDVQIFNVAGQLVQTNTMDTSKETITTFDTRNLPEGLYRISIKNKQVCLTKNLLVVKE